jgi:hypothetical protein
MGDVASNLGLERAALVPEVLASMGYYVASSCVDRLEGGH